MTDYIAKLREAGEKATAGPWSFYEVPYYFQGSGPWRTTKAEDDFIALARNAWPAMVEVVALAEKLQECIDWCEKEDEPVSGYVCERNDPLRAALTKLAEQVAAAVRGDTGGK